MQENFANDGGNRCDVISPRIRRCSIRRSPSARASTRSTSRVHEGLNYSLPKLLATSEATTRVLALSLLLQSPQWVQYAVPRGAWPAGGMFITAGVSL